MTPAAKPGAWRWYPAAMLGALGLVIAVNLGMIYAAVHSFPGAAQEAGSDPGRGYDRVLAAASRQAALGWRAEATVDAAGHPVLRVLGRDGSPLDGARVQAQVERPVGPADTRVLTLARAADSRLVGSEALPSGQWTWFVVIAQGAEEASLSGRLVVR